MLTNYVAETGVALVEELIDAVKNEQQLQWLMQAVEEKPRGVKRVGKRLTNHVISLERRHQRVPGGVA